MRRRTQPPSSNPCCTEAGASLLAQRDVLDAVRYMQGAFTLDDTRLYLLGGSGGGHMSLMMAGVRSLPVRAPL